MKSRIIRVVVTIIVAVGLGWWMPQGGRAQETATSLSAIAVSADTGEKPQSKLWFHGGSWWTVLPSTAVSPTGTWLWRLNDNGSWSNVLRLSSSTATHADTKPIGNVTHILLYAAGSTELVSVEYLSAANTYQLWSTRPDSTPVALPGSETATIDIDSTGRMWLATESATTVNVYYSDAPYAVFSGPVTVATGIADDDIAVVTALPNHSVGVLWSNQNTRRFGFRVHVDGADPTDWSTDEVPASQSALSVGLGMADDHMNVAVGSDSTLYAAVKTSYDTAGYPKIALLVRRPQGATGGTWDNLHQVDLNGTRGIVMLDELAGKVRVVYASSEGGPDIVYKESSTSAIDFSGPAQLLMSGSGGALNNPTGTKQNWTGRTVVLASTSTTARGVLITREDPNLVGYWPLNEGTGSLSRDHSGFGSDGVLQGNAAWVSGVDGSALDLDGTGDYVARPARPQPGHHRTDHPGHVGQAGTAGDSGSDQEGHRRHGRRVRTGAGDQGPSTGKPFVRFNQATSGDTFRLDALNTYPFDGNTWFHLAATYDGTVMRLYVNGVLQGEKPGPTAIASNTLGVGIGAQPSDGLRGLMGQLDDVRIYNRALTATQIAAMASANLEADLAITKTDGQSSATAGQPISYTIVATNNGPAAVTGATVTDTLPAVLSGGTWTCSASVGASCPSSGSGSINAQVNLPVGGTATFTLNATLSAGASGTVANTASIAPPSGITDAIPGNNSATDTDTVLAAPGPGLNSGLAAYWKMDEGSGTTLVDVIGQ